MGGEVILTEGRAGAFAPACRLFIRLTVPNPDDTAIGAQHLNLLDATGFNGNGIRIIAILPFGCFFRRLIGLGDFGCTNVPQLLTGGKTA